MPIIEEMYAYCAEEEPGDEGIIGFMQKGQWMPLVGADMDRVASLRQIAIEIGRATNTTVVLKQFKLVKTSTIVYKGK